MKVALIDDNNIVLKFLKLKILKEGFLDSDNEIYTYQNLSTFTIEQPNINVFDIISVDYDLGKDSIDGLTFIKHILNNGYKGECILLTGDDTYELRKKLQNIPTVHYVIKTATNDKVKSTIAQLGNIINETKERIK